MATRSKRTRQTQAERVEESTRRIFAAAIELIAEQGFDRTTTTQISDRAGYANSMLHIRYGSKEALLEALLKAHEDRLFESQEDEQRDGLSALLGQVDVVRRQLQEDPIGLRAYFMIVFEIPGVIVQVRPWLIDWLERYKTRIAELIRAGQADGSIRADVDPESEATFFMDCSTGPLFRWILDPDRVDLDLELSGWRDRMHDRFHPR